MPKQGAKKLPIHKVDTLIKFLQTATTLWIHNSMFYFSTVTSAGNFHWRQLNM
jgi:hypothetical protein